MIDHTITVQCDGATDGELCEAEFSMESYGRPIDPLAIARQLQQRGWTTDRDRSGDGCIALCPLRHARQQEKPECPKCNDDATVPCSCINRLSPPSPVESLVPRVRCGECGHWQEDHRDGHGACVEDDEAAMGGCTCLSFTTVDPYLSGHARQQEET